MPGDKPEAAEPAQDGEGDRPCLIAATHDKYDEAHYFLGQMLHEYHRPSPFRWNLNGFLQALRSVTFMLQREMTGVAGFDEWYEEQRALMSQDPLLLTFVEGRNVVVHQGMLEGKSTVEVGLFRGRKVQAWNSDGSVARPVFRGNTSSSSVGYGGVADRRRAFSYWRTNRGTALLENSEPW